MIKSLGHGFFITGTDTGIGKTYCARLLTQGFAAWLPATYMKPVQTGCLRDAAGVLSAPDFEYVMQGSAIMTGEMDDHVPYRFEPACSPHLAASRNGVMISLDHIRDTFSRLSNNKSITIVEGAGGVLTPLSETTSMLDLMLHLGLPVIIVTSARIGTINHTLLTIEALSRRGIIPVGIVINKIAEVPESYMYQDTVRVLQNHLPVARFLELDHDEACSDKVKEFCGAIFKRL
jgi:dethiobiotin synthase